MLVTIQWMREKYNYYNDLLFEGNLPSISFYINNSRKTWGMQHIDLICIMIKCRLYQ